MSVEKFSIKRIQSELGCVDPCGPNAEMCLRIGEELADNFKHVHDTNTDSDAFVFLATVNVGEDYKHQEYMNTFLCASIGCHEDLERMFFHMMADDPDLIAVMQSAILRALSHLHDKNK